MGAWGYYPKDSDGSLDLYGEMSDAANNVIDKYYKEGQKSIWDGHSKYNYVGLVMLCLQAGNHIKCKYLERCVEYLDELVWDKDFIKVWGKEKMARKAIQLCRDEFSKLVEDHKPAKGKSLKYKEQEILAPRFWMARRHEMKKGTSWSGAGELNRRMRLWGLVRGIGLFIWYLPRIIKNTSIKIKVKPVAVS